MKLAIMPLILLISTSAHAFSCKGNQVYGTFRLIADSFLCPSTFSAVKNGGEYCITEESNIKSIERVMRGYKFRDVGACLDDNGNVLKLKALNNCTDDLE